MAQERESNPPSLVARSAARRQASDVFLYLNVGVGDGRLQQLQEVPLGGREVMFFST